MSLEDLVNVQISAATATPTRAGFGTPLFAAYKVPWTSGARVRSYATLAALVVAGFLVTDPAYLMAQSAFAQNPRPLRVKIGRRTSAFTQVVNLTPGTPVASEVFTAKVDGLTVTATADGTPTVPEMCTALAAAINALADVDAIITAGVSAATLQTLLAGSFTGVIGASGMSPTRRLTFTFDSSTDWDPTTITVTGTDANGNTQTEDFAVATSTTATGTKFFAKVTQVVIPAQTAGGGTFTMGVRARVSADGSGGTTVVCTAPAGELHSYEMVTGNLSLADATTDPGIAAELTAMQAFDPDFYGVALDSNSSAEIQAAAAWVESNKKIMAVQSADAACGDSSSTTDVMYLLKATGYARTHIDFYPAIATPTGWLAAGILGSRLPVDPGSDTWAYKTIAGVTALTISDTAHTAVLAKNGNTYELVGGVNITYPGKVSAGEWADVVRGLDWLTARIREGVYAVLLNNAKVAFTDNGIDLLRSAIKAVLTEGQRVNLLANDPKPAVVTPRAAAVDSGDRAARHLPSVTFSARLAGAIQTLIINGSVSA